MAMTAGQTVAAPRAAVVAAAAVRRPVVWAASAETLGKVQGIIAEQLGTDTDKVGADSKFVDLGADSLDTVEIMMALEEEFDISIDEEGASMETPLPPFPPLPPSPRPLRACRRDLVIRRCRRRPRGPARLLPERGRGEGAEREPWRGTGRERLRPASCGPETDSGPPRRPRPAGAEKISTVQEAADMIEAMA